MIFGLFLPLISCTFVNRFSSGPPVEPVPQPEEKAATARWMVRNNRWGTLATTSTLEDFPSVAFANPNSFSDGTIDESTGQVFFYVTDMDQSMIDISSNNRASFSISEAANGLCGYRQLDPEDPRCARLTLLGTVSRVDKDDQRYVGALEKMFALHPPMRHWPVDHMFYLAELKIEGVWLVDYFGGAYSVPLEDYFAGADSTVTPPPPLL